MKPIDTSAPQRIGRPLGFCAAALLLAATASSARAGIIVPELSVVGGTGVAGGTVSVTVALADDVGDVAASADVDLVFPPDQLTFSPPVVANCEIDPRLADTHEVGGRLDGDDTIILSIFVSGTPPVIPHLGNGPLASCNFMINAGVPAGTAALAITDPGLFDDEGNPLDVTTRDGFVTIQEFVPPTVTSTPTATITPPTVVTSTATATNTGGATPTNTVEATPTSTGEVTPTVTPTITGAITASVTPTRTGDGVTATPTNTGGATATVTSTGGATATVTRTIPIGPTSTPFRFNDSSSCNIVPVDHQSSGGVLALLLAPALLVWARRRRF